MQALRFWLKLGFISLGGPTGQFAIMQREMVETRKWMSSERFLNSLNYCMLWLSPEAQQLGIVTVTLGAAGIGLCTLTAITAVS